MSSFPPPPASPAPPPSGGSHVPPPPPGTPADSDRTVMLVLAYVWLASLVPLLIRKDDKEIQWHAKNGLVLAIAFSAAQLLFFVVSYVAPILGCLTFFAPCLLALGYIVLCVLGIVKATSGQRFRIPVLTDLSEKI